jgi:hypothetical protein
VPLSCEYAFYQAQRRAGRAPNTGALLSSMLEALRKDGQPEESGWPYLSATPADEASWAPPREIGKLFGRNGATATHSIDRVIQELDQGRSVIVLTMLSRAFYQRNPQGVVDPAAGEQPEPDRRHADRSRQGEDHVIIGDRQEFGLTLGEASLGCRALALRGVAVAAGVVGDAFVRAVLAALDVSAERGGPAGLDRRHDLQLAEAHMAGVGLAPRRPWARKTSATSGL